MVARLEALRHPYFLTGSEALARYGEARMSNDLDFVLDLEGETFAEVEGAFEGAYSIAPPIEYPEHGIDVASAIAIETGEKADIFLARGTPWQRSAFARRERWVHPDYGEVWVISLEDLVLSKLWWASIVPSDLQLRDVDSVVAITGRPLDVDYLKRWAGRLGVSDALARAVGDA